MPLDILLALVVGGISVTALLLHLTGRSRRTRLDEASALRAWLRHAPDDTAKLELLAADGHAALITGQNGPGLVWSFGADTTARHLVGATVREVPSGLRVDFHDFGAPAFTLELTEPERARWRQMMTAPQEAA